MPSKVRDIEPKIMQHQFIGDSELKSASAIDADQQTSTKLILMDEPTSSSSVSLFVDDQTSFTEFYLYNEFLFYDDISYSISLESPDGIVIDSGSADIIYTRDSFTGLNKLSITDPTPGEWIVTAVLDSAVTPVAPVAPFKTKAKLASEIKAQSLIEQYNHDVREQVELSALLTIPSVDLLDVDNIQAYAILQNEHGLSDTISLTNIQTSNDTLKISDTYPVDTTGVYNYTLIVNGVYNEYRFERAVYGDFVVQNLSSVIVIPNQELNLSNRSVEIKLPNYFNSHVIDVDSVTFEVGIDSMSFVDGDFYFAFDSETKQLSLNVVENASMSEAWFWVECYASDSIVANTTFRVKYTTPGVPSNLFASELTSSSANLNWIPQDVEDKWDLVFGLSGFDLATEGELIENVTEYPYSLQALNTGIGYEFYVRAVLNEVQSEWSWPMTFVTDHIITANATNNGTITPQGIVEVGNCEDQLFNFSPDDHYHISDVLVNGVSMGAVSSYLFRSVSAAQTIDVQYNINVYTILGSPNNSEYGTVTGSGNFEYEQYVTLEAIPADGYVFLNWSENGTTVSTEPVLDFQAEADRTLVAIFELATGLSGNGSDNIQIFPNPFKNTITIINAIGFEKVSLTNSFGQIIIAAPINNQETTTITTPDLPTGIYLITLEGNSGNRFISKIVKE